MCLGAVRGVYGRGFLVIVIVIEWWGVSGERGWGRWDGRVEVV